MSHDGKAIKQKAGTKTMPAPAICTAADAVGYEIDLSWGESRRDIVFYTAASGVAHGKKIAGIPKDTSLYDLYRSGCCRVRNWFAMHQNDASPYDLYRSTCYRTRN